MRFQAKKTSNLKSRAAETALLKSKREGYVDIEEMEKMGWMKPPSESR